MNKNEMAEVMLSDGPWEFRYRMAGPMNPWRPIPNPCWSWDRMVYRVSPKPREIFVNEYEDGGRVPYIKKEDALHSFSHRREGIPAVRYVRASDVG